MTIVQLSPLIPLDTPRGQGMAHLMIDPGFEHHLQFVVFLDASGECWTFEARHVRLRLNVTARGYAKDETMGKLTTKARKGLPAEKFAGLNRSYPVPDRSHAANAKARASQAVNEGRMSKSQEARIDAKADRVLGRGKKK